ncbi:MAG: YjbH domain-containing protein [Campylobacterota bacterium]|nr:YjbH domain-containing protein [Campylobacterota bacterium]
MKQTTLLLFFSLSLVDAAELSHSLSYQGYTGVVNTPNAQVMDEGEIGLHYDNQLDNVTREYMYDKPYKLHNDYIIGAGILPHFEFQGRVAETTRFAEDLSISPRRDIIDLSFNFKFQLPYKHKYLPNFALGAQDFGGAANRYGNYYVVMDKEVSFVRASLGYGKAAKNNYQKSRRMDGIFGALEVQTFEWLYLLAEDDTTEQFVGVRVETPSSWSSWVGFNAVLSSNVKDNYSRNFGLNMTLNLYEDTQSSRVEALTSSDVSKGSSKNHKEQEKIQKNDTKKQDEAKSTLQDEPKPEQEALSLSAIKERLVALGIENVTLAYRDKKVYIGYENSVYLWNELDAMGVIIGLLAQSEYERLVLESFKSGVSVITLSGNLQKAKEFYRSPTVENKQQFTSSLQKISKVDLSNYSVVYERENSSLYRPKVELKPYMKTFLANEFGVFTYKLWLRSKLQLNLYDGIDLTAVGDIHIHDSDYSERFGWFLKLYEDGSNMQSVMLHMSNNLFGAMNTLSIGTFQQNFYGFMDQFAYNYGNHTLQLKYGIFQEFQEDDPMVVYYYGRIPLREVYLANYSYLFESYDILGEVKLGQFWNRDKGFDLRMKRFFGDTALFIEYQHSIPYFQTSVNETVNKYIGFGFEIPLTPKETPNFKYGQLRGTNAYKHRTRTTILRDDKRNTLVPGSNFDPKVAIDSESYFYNRNRLQLSYIQEHAFRLQESYEKYGK